MPLSSVAHLYGLSQIRDGLMCMVSAVMAKLLTKVRYARTFDHLWR